MREARPSSPRLHYFDYLRSFAVLLGLGLHSAMVYTTSDLYSWYIKIKNGFIWIDNLILIIHIYYMPLFFFIAGFFANNIYKKYHLSGLIQNRFHRIVIIFLIVMLILLPGYTTDMVRAMYVTYLSKGGSALTQNQIVPWVITTIKQGFASGAIWHYYNNTYSYWFLYYLMLYYLASIIVILVMKVSVKCFSSKILSNIYKIFSFIYTSPFALTLILFIILSFSQKWYIDIDLRFNSPPHIIIYYAVFYFMGWFMCQYDTINYCTKYSIIYFMVAILMCVAYLVLYTLQFNYGDVHYAYYKMLCMFFYGSAAIFLVKSSIGLAINYLNKPRKVVRYLADASYWLYISQIPLVVLMQIIMIQTSYNYIIQYLCIFLSSLLILLICYKLFVRHTWIGQLLNGTRHANDS